MISENTSQTALFATLSTTMSLQHMQSVRELLKTRVGESLGDGHEFELQVMKVSASPKSIVSWISKAGKGLPVIIIDEAHPHPRSATWLADMKESLGDLKSPVNLMFVGRSRLTTIRSFTSTSVAGITPNSFGR